MTLIPITAKRLQRESQFVRKNARAIGTLKGRILWLSLYAWRELMAGRVPTDPPPPSEVVPTPRAPCGNCGDKRNVAQVKADPKLMEEMLRE